MASFTPHLRRRVSKWKVFNQNYAGQDNDNFVVGPGEHLFKDFEDEHVERARSEKGIADLASFDRSKHEHAIVAVGTTGTGKSSIVQLFCGDAVGVSHDTTSATKKAALFDEIGDESVRNRKWMDTQGTDDSDMDDTDEKILKKIFKKLWERKIHFVIVLWLISGDFDRQKGEYLRQAQFIAGLQTAKSKSNIWESVLMVQKMGTLQPKMKKIQGIIDAAKKNGAKMAWIDDDALQDHVVGFKCVDLLDLKGGDDTYDALVEAGTPKQKLIGLGYVTQNEMKAILTERLKKIDVFMLDYEDKVCEKCSLRGDPRYLYIKCHHLPVPHHPKAVINFHPRDLEEWHPIGTHVIHPGEIEHIHTSSLEQYHPEDVIEMEVDDKANPIYEHEGEFITIIKTGMFSCCAQETKKWNCCQNESEYAKGCKTLFPKKTIRRFPCCKKEKDKVVDEEEKGCDEQFHGGCQKRYKCCMKKEGSDPCVAKYKCCDEPPNSDGCKEVFRCCGEELSVKGCQERYACCKLAVVVDPDDGTTKHPTGCEQKWECCEQAPEELGCQTVCGRCKVRWGHKPGCSFPEKDDAKNGSDDEDAPDYADADDADTGDADTGDTGDADNGNGNGDQEEQSHQLSDVDEDGDDEQDNEPQTDRVRSMSNKDLM